jgi:hypothetical protein
MTAEPLARGDGGGEVSAASWSDSPPAMRPREFDEDPPPYGMLYSSIAVAVLVLYLVPAVHSSVSA